LTITLTKEIKGQEFKDLDLLTKLLAPRKITTEPNIEVLSTQDNEEEAELVAKTDKLTLEQNEILQGMCLGLSLTNVHGRPTLH
jgi:protein SHQ1